MKHLATITDKDITGSDALATAEPRIAVSAVLFDRDNNIALQYLSNYEVYALVGGAVDPGEDLLTAIKREVLEESGCDCEIIGELGYTFESLAEPNKSQKRYNYIARVVGEKGKLQLTEDEISWGAVTCWHPIEKALQLIKETDSSYYVHKFMRLREIAVLTEVITNHMYLVV